MRVYGLGDAQIDAQNATTSQIGQIKAQYNAMKSAGTLTAAQVQLTEGQIYAAIQSYSNQYANTPRGKAGETTLLNFVNSQMVPEFTADLARLSKVPAPAAPAAAPAPVGGSAPAVVTPISVSTPAAPSSGGAPISSGPPISDSPIVYNPAMPQGSTLTLNIPANSPSQPANIAPSLTPQINVSTGGAPTPYMVSSAPDVPVAQDNTMAYVIGAALLLLLLSKK